MKKIVSKHTAFVPAPISDKYLWRLMDVQKLHTLISDRGLWFARLDQFNDPREGTLPYGNLGILSKYSHNAEMWAREEYGYTVRRSFASCWHRSDSDPSYCIWKVFGGGSFVAVRTTPELLADELAAYTSVNGPLYIQQVEYVDHGKDKVKEGNFIYPAFAVRTEFRDESEARVLIHTHGTIAYDFLYNKRGPYGDLIRTVAPAQSYSGKHEWEGGHAGGTAIVLPVDPERFVLEIRRGPETADRHWNTAVEIATNQGLQDRLKG